MEKKIFIEGMSCEHCAKHVKEALSDVEGVANVVVNLAENYAIIETNTEIKDKIITVTIEELEYGVSKIETV